MFVVGLVICHLDQQWEPRKAHDQEAKLRQKVARKFRELDEDGEGLTLGDATWSTWSLQVAGFGIS